MADISTNPPLSGRLQALCFTREAEVWTGSGSGASYTERTPVPGLPSASQTSYFMVAPGGTPTGTADLEVNVREAGLPGQVDPGAMISCRRNGESLYLGGETCGTLSFWEPVLYGTTHDYSDPDIATLPDGTVITVAKRDTNNAIVVKVRDPDDFTLGSETVVFTGANRFAHYPCLCVIGDEVYVLAWVQIASGQYSTDKDVSLHVWRSTDLGVTWALVQNDAAPRSFTSQDGDTFYAVLDYSAASKKIRRTRAAYRDGEVCVVVWYQDTSQDDCDYIIQLAGPALTARLDLVAMMQNPPGDAGWAVPAITATPAGFAVVYVDCQEETVMCRLIGSAWQPISSAAAYDVGPDYTDSITASPLAGEYLSGPYGLDITYDPAGVLWVIATETDDASGPPVTIGNVSALYSNDNGQTWTYGSSGRREAWWQANDTESTAGMNYPIRYGVTWQRGRAIVAASMQCPVETGLEDSIVHFYLGGHSDLTIPTSEKYQSFYGKMGDRRDWHIMWAPPEGPENQLWTDTNVGTNSVAANTGGYHEITTGDGLGVGATGQRHFSETPKPSATSNAYLVGGAEFHMYVSAGDAAEYAEVKHELGDGVNYVSMSIRIYTNQFVVYDNVAASVLDTIAISTGTYYQWRYGIDYNPDTDAGKHLQVWYRTANSAENRRWTLVDSYTLSSAAGAVNTTIYWGHIVASGDNTILRSRWREVKATLDEHGWYDTDNWSQLNQAGGDNPDILHGFPIGIVQSYMMDGLTLAGRRGPAWLDDEFSIPITGEYEIDRAFSLDVPSRRISHRTVNDTPGATVVIPWAIDADRPLQEDTSLPPLMFVHIECNWRSGSLKYRTVAGAWTQIVAIDNQIVSGGAFTRTGKLIRSAAAGTTYFTRDEVDDRYTVQWDNGAGTTRYRHPAGNHPGYWTNSTSQPRAAIELASTLAGDPTSGGTCSIWSPSVTILFQGLSASALRVEIDNAYPTADGYYQTKIWYGEAHILAQPPDWGRGFTAIPGHERVGLEGDIGVRVERAPATRELRFAYDVGIDESEIRSGSSVRYVTASSGGVEPASAVGEIPASLVAAIERQAGRPVGWVVYDRTTPGAVILRRKHEQLWGTIAAAPDDEVNLGQEGYSEVHRLSAVTLREER